MASTAKVEVEREEEKTHVLLVTFSSQGHLNPMLELARRLASLGLRPTLASTDLTRHRIFQFSSSSSSLLLTPSPSSPVTFSFFSDGLPLSFDRWNNLPTFFHHLSLEGPRHLSRLISSSPRPFSLLVFSPFLPWAARVAISHGIPSALLWIQPLVVFSLYHHHFTNPTTAFPFPLDDLPSHLRQPTSDDPILPVLRDLFTRTLQTTRWVLANTLEELEGTTIEAVSRELHLPVIPVGPLVPAEENEQRRELAMWKADDSCERWLDEQAEGSVVYVSFGSLARPSPAQARRVVEGLARCGYRYLWVAKGYSIPEGEGQGKVVGWCEQARVLGHAAVGCFVSHCGWNSTVEAAARGMPVVGLPQWADQGTNARLAEGWGLGVRLRKDEEVEEEGGEKVASAAEVERGVREVMGGGVRWRARELGEKLRTAMREGGGSYVRLKRLVEEVVKLASLDSMGEPNRTPQPNP